jgi:NADH-ubiquinone oxidoreductase chain 1
LFFFLGEYASIVLICVLNSILFLGGYIGIFIFYFYFSPLNLAIKTVLLIFVFIWVRASFPRIRFDQLMSVCWTVLLPIVIAFVILISCFVISLDVYPTPFI